MQTENLTYYRHKDNKILVYLIVYGFEDILNILRRVKNPNNLVIYDNINQSYITHFSPAIRCRIFLQNID